MNRNSNGTSSKKSNVVGAGAAGGGIGTLIASFADSLPEDNELKTFLAVTAPIITVFISGLWLFIKTVYIDPFAASKKHDTTHKHISKLLADARKAEEQVLNAKHSTEAHKKQIRGKVEELEKLLMDTIIENVEYA